MLTSCFDHFEGSGARNESSCLGDPEKCLGSNPRQLNHFVAPDFGARIDHSYGSQAGWGYVKRKENGAENANKIVPENVKTNLPETVPKTLPTKT